MSNTLPAEILQPAMAPEQAFWDKVRTAANAVIDAVNSLPEFSAMNANPYTLGDGVMRKDESKRTEIPAEDPEAVKKRDGVEDETWIRPHGSPSVSGASETGNYPSGRTTPSGPPQQE